MLTLNFDVGLCDLLLQSLYVSLQRFLLSFKDFKSFTYFFSSSSEPSLVTTWVVFGDKTLLVFFAAIDFFINGSIKRAS
jgi:hypothetical protein